jgi:hypothetical protein
VIWNGPIELGNTEYVEALVTTSLNDTVFVALTSVSEKAYLVIGVSPSMNVAMYPTSVTIGGLVVIIPLLMDSVIDVTTVLITPSLIDKVGSTISGLGITLLVKSGMILLE